MPWERRGRKRYFYSAQKRNGVVRKTYMGKPGNPFVETLARHERLAAADRRADAEAFAGDRHAWRLIDMTQRQLVEMGDRLLRAGLLALGYRRTKRGGLAKLKGNAMKDEDNSGRDGSVWTYYELESLAARAEAGDWPARVELRAVLRENPGIWEPIGDLATVAEDQLIGVLAEGAALVEESLRLEMEELKQSLLKEGDSPLERLLVEQVVLFLLRLRHHQLACSEDRSSRTESAFWAKQAAQALKGFRDASESLARVRTLQAESVRRGQHSETSRSRR